MKKNKLVKFLLFIMLFSFFTTTVKARSISGYEYTDSGRSNDEEIVLTCRYMYKESNKKEKNELIIEARTMSLGYSLQITPYVDGKRNTDALSRSGKKFKDEALLENELLEYLEYYGKCPAYAGYFKGSGYDNGFALGDTTDSLKGAQHILELTRTKQNTNYCHYTFPDAKPYEWRMDHWGVWMKKQHIDFIEIDPEKGCPTTLITEGDITFGDAFSYNKPRYYATYNSEETAALLQLCETEAKEDVAEYEDAVSLVKCYAAPLDIPQNIGGAPGDPGQEDPIPELSCDALFDYETKQFIDNAYFIIEILAIVAVILLTIKDFSLGILNSNQDEIKKAGKRLLTRLIILVIILLLPAILKLVLGIFNIEMFSSDPLCGTIKK